MVGWSVINFMKQLQKNKEGYSILKKLRKIFEAKVTCNHCGEDKKKEEYYENKRSFKGGEYYYDRRPECKECTKQSQR